MGIPERKERDFRRREQDILDAALPLFDREDWLSVTIDEIAQKAEIGKGTVYLHFPSKEAIYARLALDFSHELLRRMREVALDSPPLERIGERIRLFIEAHRTRPEYRRLLEYCWRKNFLESIPAAMAEAFASLDAEYNRLVVDDLEAAMSAGVVPRGVVETQAQGLKGMVLGAVHVLWSGCFERPGELADSRQYVELMVRSAIAGLRFQHVAFDTDVEVGR